MFISNAYSYVTKVRLFVTEKLRTRCGVGLSTHASVVFSAISEFWNGARCNLIAVIDATAFNKSVYNVMRRHGVYVGVDNFLETEKVCFFGQFFNFFIPFAHVGKLYGIA